MQSAAPPEVKKLTIAELMNRVATAPPDSFLFPCTLNAYSKETRFSLLKLRQQWLSKEQDSRYLVAPSTGCICPSVCVLLVEDTQAVANKGALILFDEGSSEKYYWLTKNLDLSHTSLSWVSSTPQLTLKDEGGNETKRCSIEQTKSGTPYSINCTDSAGKSTSLAR
jgi:hypothetical protein